MEAMSGRKAGRDGMWHPDGGGKVRLVMTNIDSSMKQSQTRLGGWAGPAGWEKDELVIKRRAGNVAGGGAGVEGGTLLPSSMEAEAANHGAGAGAGMYTSQVREIPMYNPLFENQPPGLYGNAKLRVHVRPLKKKRWFLITKH